MKHFIDPATQQVYAYEADGSQDAFIKPGLVPISDDDLAVHRAAARDSRDAIGQQIAELEAMITPRRMREAILSGDSSFIESIDVKIAALRGAL